MNQFILGVFGPFQILFFSLIFALVPLVIHILFNISMQRAMNAVSSQNRKMEGGLIWLNLIPFLNIVWPFIFNGALRTSYKNEFQQKGISHKVDLVSGFIYPGAQILSIIVFVIGLSIAEGMVTQAVYYQNASYVNNAAAFGNATIIFMSLLSLISLILWIFFWVNVNGLRSILERHDSRETGSVNYQQYIHAEPIYQNTVQVERPIIQSDPVTIKTETTANIPETQPKTEPLKQSSAVEKLKKYHEMLSEGLITQADFDKVKHELLNQK